MKNISHQFTTDQVRQRIKTVTRRLDWLNVKKGDLLRIIVKGMGLKKGESQEGLALVVVIDARREPLRRMVDELEYGFAECVNEGFPPPHPKSWPSEFVAFFCGSHSKCTPETIITRIEYRYIPGGRLS